MSGAVVLLTGADGLGLVAAATGVADEVTVLAAAAPAAALAAASLGATRVVSIVAPPAVPAEGCAATVADLVERLGPDLVLTGRDAASRVLLGAVAGRLRVPVVGDAVALGRRSGALVVTRRLLGGLVESLERADGPVAVALEPPAGPHRSGPAPVAVDTVSAGTGSLRVLDEVAGDPAGDLAAAERVVAVGRGLRDAADLALIHRLADALGAEVGCSRPLSEGLGWLPGDRTIGLSGRHLRPALYLCLGISGQLQHLAGVRDAGTIVAINSDPHAPILRACDHGIIGDLYEVVPALLRELGRRSGPAQRPVVHGDGGRRAGVEGPG